MWNPVRVVQHKVLLTLLFLLSIDGVSANPEFEPNNQFHQANFIPLDGSVEGKISTSDDLDWFKVYVPDNSIIALEISLTSAKILSFPFNNSKWKVFVYDPNGSLLNEQVVDLTQSNSINVRAEQGGTYYIAVNDEGFSSDEEYSLSAERLILDEPTYSDFSGIWYSPSGHYISAHQTADRLVFSILYTTPNYWDVQTGTVVDNTVSTRTIYGDVAVEFDITMTSIGILKAVQTSCEPAQACAFPNGTEFTATRQAL